MHTASLPRPRRFSCSLHGAPRSLPGGRRRQHTRGPRSSPRAVHTLVRRTRLLHRMGQHLLPRGSAHPPRPAGAHVRSFEPRHSPRASGGGPAGPTTKDNVCKGSCYPGLLGWGEAGCRGALLCSYVSETFIFLLWHLNVQPVTRKLRKHIPMGWGGRWAGEAVAVGSLATRELLTHRARPEGAQQRATPDTRALRYRQASQSTTTHPETPTPLRPVGGTELHNEASRRTHRNPIP